MSKNYRWGILGAGRIAEKFCTALDSVEGSQVYAVASRNEENAKLYADRHKAEKHYFRYEDLLKDENVDIVYIATPHAFHYEHTMLCLQYNKPVLCEKPMSLSYEQTKEMIDFAVSKNIFLMEGMWTSCMPSIQRVLSIIKDDVIGKPQYLSADFGFAAPVDVEGRLYNKKLGGGSIMDVGIYPVFLSALIFGEPATIKSLSKLSATGIDEYANIILQYPNGETAHLLSSIIFNTGIEAEIIGTKGRIQIKVPWFKGTDLSVCLNDGSVEDFSFPHSSNGFEHEIIEVMHCLDNGLLESKKMPHHLTLTVSKILQQVLEQSGVSYE